MQPSKTQFVVHFASYDLFSNNELCYNAFLMHTHINYTLWLYRIPLYGSFHDVCVKTITPAISGYIIMMKYRMTNKTCYHVWVMTIFNISVCEQFCRLWLICKINAFKPYTSRESLLLDFSIVVKTNNILSGCWSMN